MTIPEPATDAARAMDSMTDTRRPAGAATRSYRVTHRTEYTYDKPVATGHTIARLTPRGRCPTRTSLVRR